MKRPVLVLLLLISSFASPAAAQENRSGDPSREYRLMFGSLTELEPIATAGLTFNRMVHDLYYDRIGPVLSEKIRPVSEIAWSIFWTFTFTMWPHDGGHWARAEQIGGNFIIHGYSFPFPEAEMKLPSTLKPGEGTLSSIGGFEINYLMSRQVRNAFYGNGYVHADDLIHFLIQHTHFPFYAFLLTPADPTVPETWTDTYGDPVECVLSVYENYTGRPAIRNDGSVDPDLVRQYREASYLSLLWTLLDPMLYRSAGAFGADMYENRGLTPSKMLIGNGQNGWIYGTQFHPSPLGYELYFTNYMHLKGNFYTVYLKWGRPYRNIGIGISAPGLLETGKTSVGLSCDLWDQDIYGRGAALSVNTEFRAGERFSLFLDGTWKDRGYLIGKRIRQSVTIQCGFGYRF
jgi:hypothetical protein